MEETTPTIPTTASTPDWQRNTTVFPVPEAKTYQLSDGTIRIEIGEFFGFVSSWHLVDKKENELIHTYRNHHESL